MEHNHKACSNHLDSMLTFKGCAVSGALDVHDGYILIFECGFGLKFRQNGAFWVVAKEEVDCLIADIKKQLVGAGA